MTTSSIEQASGPAGAARSAPPPLQPGADALFLDFDGTLAEIVEHPDDAKMSAGRAEALDGLAAAFGGALAVVSGRSLADLTLRVSDRLWRVGGHGEETAGPGETAPLASQPANPALLDAAEAMAQRHRGVFVEIKPTGLALHFRQNPEAGAECAAAMEAAVRAAPAYSLHDGKMVVEARPKNANKGRALRMLMERAPFAGRRPVMVGDDLTDEAAIEAAIALGGLGVKVGEGNSAADFGLESVDAVHAWLSDARRTPA